MALLNIGGAATTLTRTANQGVLLQNGTDKTLSVSVTGGVASNFSSTVAPGVVVYLDGLAATTSSVVTAALPHGTSVGIVGSMRVTATAD